MAANMKMTVFWDIAPRSLVEIYRRSSGASIIRAMIAMEAVSTSETFVSLYQTTRRNIPEDSQSSSDFKSSDTGRGIRNSCIRERLLHVMTVMKHDTELHVEGSLL
jgi:hypothetical protein